VEGVRPRPRGRPKQTGIEVVEKDLSHPAAMQRRYDSKWRTLVKDVVY